MFGATDPSGLNGPWQLSSWRSLVTIGTSAFMIGGYFTWKFLAKRLALRRQQRLAAQAKPNAAALIQQAVAQIEAIRQAINNQQITPKDAAAQLSDLVRTTFDATMNHTTRYQTKFEIAQRRLDHLIQLLDISYPVEFSDQPSVQQTLLTLCDKSRQVVESCR